MPINGKAPISCRPAPDAHDVRPSKAQAGFTVIEILLVLALIGMITGVLIVGTNRLFDDGPSTPYDIFWASVSGARKQALMSGRDVRLTFQPTNNSDSGSAPPALVTTWENGGTKTYAFGKMSTDLVCEFLSTQKGTQTILVGGELLETQTIPFITFYGDGTCTPCRVQMRVGTGVMQVIAIDPWTCAEMLPKQEGAR